MRRAAVQRFASKQVAAANKRKFSRGEKTWHNFVYCSALWKYTVLLKYLLITIILVQTNKLFMFCFSKGKLGERVGGRKRSTRKHLPLHPFAFNCPGWHIENATLPTSGSDGTLGNNKFSIFSGGDKPHCLMFSGHLLCVQQHHSLSLRSFQFSSEPVSHKEIQILLLTPIWVKYSGVIPLERSHLFADHVTSTQSPSIPLLHLLTPISMVQKQEGWGETVAVQGQGSSPPGEVPSTPFLSATTFKVKTPFFSKSQPWADSCQLCKAHSGSENLPTATTLKGRTAFISSRLSDPKKVMPGCSKANPADCIYKEKSTWTPSLKQRAEIVRRGTTAS